MSARDLTNSDFAGLELQSTRFAELDDHDCSPAESAAMTVGAFLLLVAAPAIVLFAWVIR